jgi:glycosyltransferase involved in cell wall biosynthesis
VIDALARGLAARGHEVVLFATGDSAVEGVELTHLYEEAFTDQIGVTPIELSHVHAAYESMTGCDIVHDHTLAGLLAARHHHGPVVTTSHGRFVDPYTTWYRRTASEVPLIAISANQAGHAPADLPVAAVIHHGIDLTRYRFDASGGDHLVTIGRMTPGKGIDRAMDIARQTGIPLVVAAKQREPAEHDYYRREIKPRLGPGITYIGEADHDTKIELLTGALALLNPIQWEEPFGMVMIEALACGTPVIATPNGSAPELISQGVTGYLTPTPRDLRRAVRALDHIDRGMCRHHAEHRFSMAAMAEHHELFYRAVVDHQHPA